MAFPSYLVQQHEWTFTDKLTKDAAFWPGFQQAMLISCDVSR
jgi:hypothetical protein